MAVAIRLSSVAVGTSLWTKTNAFRLIDSLELAGVIPRASGNAGPRVPSGITIPAVHGQDCPSYMTQGFEGAKKQ